MKYIIGLLAMLLPILSGAQALPVEALRVGDTVPDIALNKMTNYKISSAKLSDFKGDLLLLDYWGTWCSGCLQSFPKMDSLKREFESVQILLVNTKSKISKDNEEKILNTLKRLNERTGSDISLPVVYNNDQLDALFPLKYIPQVVWISKNKVIAITGSEEVTAGNISTVLNGGILSVHTKNDLLSYNEHIPLFENGNGGVPRKILYRSMITGYIEGIGGRNGYRMENNKITGLFRLNQSFLNLVRFAYSDVVKYPDNRIFIESAAGKLLKDRARTNLYCYELVIPPSDEQVVKQYMRQDLKKYFGTNVHNEIRKLKCLVLKRSRGLRTSSNEITDKSFDLQKNTLKKFIHNRSVPFSVRVLNQYCPVPIVDESDAKENISLELPFDLTDIKGLENAFHKAGFTLKEEERKLEVTVISDL